MVHLVPVRHTLSILSAVLFCLGAPAAPVAHTQAELILAADSVKPGDSVLAGVHLRMDPEWHTYWKNSGASGMPTTIEWQLPRGVTAGETEWPLPEKLFDTNLTTYIYNDEVILLTSLRFDASLAPGPLAVKAKVSWLECKTLCLPGNANVRATVNVAAQTKRSARAGLLESWQKHVPQKASEIGAQASWEKPAAGDTRSLLIEWNSPKAASEADFFPDASSGFEVGGETWRVPAETGKIRIRKEVRKTEGDWPSQVSGVLVQGSGSERQGYAVTVPVKASGAPAAASSRAVGGPLVHATAVPPLGLMLLYAFIGGLILNIMPCVLPVIALKILSFVGQAKNDPLEARKLGLIYALGVLVSFLVLAGLVIGLQAAGHRAGWGIQFSNPYFLVVMTTLVTLIALNLFGVFEVQLGGRTMDRAARLSGKHGSAGAFFNGLLATVLATSCTAPFLGAAVGFAFAPGQSMVVTLLMFLMVGVGLAFPYVVLSWQPGWLRFLPKPGSWMERFKIAMGFPMLAAAVWLFSLAALFYGERSWWLAVFLVFVALAAWIYGEFVQRHRAWPGVAGAAVVIVLVSGYAFALETHLQWRRPLGLNGGSAPAETNGVAWRTWSPAAVAQARAERRPVLVDFTAKWCLTCNTVVKPALESAAVRKKLRDINAVALLADYTGVPDEMTDELKRFGRAGVPLVLVYPKNPSSPPDVLPEALTPGMVLRALDRAAD